MNSALWIMRHGQAAPGHPDSQRALTEAGRQEVARMAAWLAETLDEALLARLQIAASPYLRAQQTATIVADHLGKSVETLNSITPDDPVEPVLDWLQANARDVVKKGEAGRADLVAAIRRHAGPAAAGGPRA